MNGKVYSSIADALKEVNKEQMTTITLLQSVTEDVTIPCGFNLVIEGDGKYIGKARSPAPLRPVRGRLVIPSLP